MDYRSAIFDLDGTVLESSGGDLSWIHNAVRDVLEDNGCTADLNHSELEALAGLKSKKEFVSVCKDFELDPELFWTEVKECRARRKKEVIESGNMTLCEGALDLLKYLRDNEVRLGLISNSPDASVDLIIRYFGLDRYFHFYRGVIDLEDLGMEKPNPVHIEIAMSELEESPFVYVGDSSVDVEAAERAGIDSIKVSKDSNLLEIKDSF